jgi:hypothetical protein
MRLYIACTALLLSLAPIARAGDTENERRTLKGLKGMEVFIVAIPPAAEQNGLTKSAIQTDVELKLRQAAITVLDLKPGQPWLSVEVEMGIRTESPWTYSISVELHQSVILTRDPSIFFSDATTWSAGSFGSVPKAQVGTLRDDIKDIVDKFVNAYLAVNPKK